MREMRRKNIVPILIFFNVLLWIHLFGNTVQVRSYVDKNVVGLNQQFTLKVEISGENVNSASNPNLPNMDDFSHFLGSGSSQNYQFVNGKTSVSKIISYHFQASKIGTFTIGAVTVQVGQQTIKTEPIEITIQKSASTSHTRSSTSNRQQQASDQISPEDLFMKATVNKRQVYQNEPVILTYKIYTLVNISNLSMSKEPGTAGFWVEEYPMNQQLPTSYEVVNGKRYTVATLKRLALFPMSSGPKTLDPMIIDCDVRVRSRSRNTFDSFFNDPFFGGRSIRKILSSNAIQITVLPLPEEGKPSQFSGLVGQYNITSTVDKHQTKTNEAVTLKVTMSGTGNIKMLPEPKIKFPNDFELYPPKSSDKINRQNSGISGSKTFEYVLIPRLPGSKMIPAIKLNYFNPKTKQYQTTSTSPVQLEITKGDESFTVVHGEGGKTQVQWFGQDIRFIKSKATAFYERRQYIAQNALFWIILILPWVGIASAYAYRKQQNRLHGDVAYARDRRAGRAAKKRLCVAKANLQISKQKEFYAEIAKALTGYLGDKLNIAEAGLMTDEAISHLNKRGVSRETMDLYFDCLKTCDRQRFSPTDAAEDQMRTFFKKSENALTQLEKEIS